MCTSLNGTGFLFKTSRFFQRIGKGIITLTKLGFCIADFFGNTSNLPCLPVRHYLLLETQFAFLPRYVAWLSFSVMNLSADTLKDNQVSTLCGKMQTARFEEIIALLCCLSVFATLCRAPFHCDTHILWGFLLASEGCPKRCACRVQFAAPPTSFAGFALFVRSRGPA